MITYHHEVTQGSDEWLQMRCGLICASEMKLIVTPAQLKKASNADSRAHLYELLAQRLTKYVEPHYISDDMMRGQEDEVDAKILYNANYAPVQDVGFLVNDKWGFSIGFSPDGLVGDDGLIECKSRRQKYQIETISNGAMPIDYMLQVQTGLLVSERKWCDFISYSGGLPMMTVRVEPDLAVQKAIVAAATAFEDELLEKMLQYKGQLKSEKLRFLPTERRVEKEIVI